jgi:capsular polysaccharide biosynthesis protein
VPALLAAAGTAIAEGRHEAALALFDRAVAAAPRECFAARAKAALLVELGRPAEAVTVLADAVAAHPADADARFDLAGACIATGRVLEAAEALRAGLALEPDAPAGLRGTLVALDMATGRYDEAAERYEEGLVRGGSDPALHTVTVAPFVGIPDWCAANGAPWWPVEAPSPVEIRLPRYDGDTAPPVSIVPWQPPRYVAEIPDAIVTGGSSVIATSDADLLLDIATHPGAARFDLAHDPVRWAGDGIALADIRAPDAAPLEVAINLVGTFSHNYYHWLLEILPRLATLEAAWTPADAAGLPILVDAAPASTPQLREALVALAPGHPLVVVPKGRTRLVRRLIVPSQLAWLPPDLHDGLEMRAGDTIVAREAIAFLRDRFLPLFGAPAGTSRRRISMFKPHSSRLVNGAELEPVCGAFGLERVRPELLSFAEQVRLFSEAEVVVIEGGAAVASLAFAPPGARVVVLVGDGLDHSFFSPIADHAGAVLTHVAGTRVGFHPKQYQRRYAVGPEILHRALERALA